MKHGKSLKNLIERQQTMTDGGLSANKASSRITAGQSVQQQQHVIPASSSKTSFHYHNKSDIVHNYYHTS